MVIEKQALAEWSRGAFAGMRLWATRYEAGSLMPPHAHATASMSLVVSGTFAERIDGERRMGPGLSVIVKPSGVVHETRCGAAACRTVSLEVPSGLESRLRARVGAFACVAHEDGASLTAALLTLWRRARDCDMAPDDVWMERWWASGVFGVEPDPRRRDRRLDAALAIGAAGGSAAAAADAVGMHPVHLCRLFHAATGRGTAASFRRARVRRAAEQLCRGGSLTGIAATCGFADQAHMTRAFVRESGATPGAMRSLLAGCV